MRADRRGQPPQIRLARRKQRVDQFLRRFAVYIRAVLNLQPLAIAGNVAMRFARHERQFGNVFAPPPNQIRAHLGQLLIPRVQRAQKRRARCRRAQKLVALLQRPIVALHRIIIRRLQLRKRHIHESAPLRRAVLHRSQILRRKQHARDMPQQLARARNLLPRDLQPPLAHRRQKDLDIVAAVAAQRVDFHIRRVRAPAHQIAILPRSMRAPGAGQVNRLQNIRLSLPVIADQRRNALARREQAFRIRPKIPKPQLNNPQFNPPSRTPKKEKGARGNAVSPKKAHQFPKANRAAKGAIRPK